MKQYYVYILGNLRPSLYIGITNNLLRRIYEHKQRFIEGFTKKYKLNRLLYFEIFYRIEDALSREKQLKHWNREWKLNLIRKVNPKFDDLYNSIIN